MGLVTTPNVSSIAKAGSTKLSGDVTLTGGTNVTLTQSGQDISIAASGGGGGSGDVVGPGSATDNAVARFDGTTGKLIQDSVVIVSDTGAISGVTDLAISGSTASAFINASGTLNNATGDENAYVLDFTVNKATSGTTIGLKMNMTDTSSPGTAYLMDLQKTSSSKFRVDENGNLETSNITGTAGSGIRIDGGTASGADLKLRSTSHATPGNVQIEDNILFDGTIFKTSASSFTIRDQINRDILVANATDLFINDVPVTIENLVTINDSIVITQDVGSVTVSPAMTLTSAAHTGLTGETKDLYIDLSDTKTYAASTTVAQNRFLHIEAPVVTGPNTTTLTEIASVCIGGTPAVAGGSSVNVTTSIGFLLEQTTASQQISAAVGFVIYAPDIPVGSPTFAACGSFLDGVVGVGTTTPAAWLDVRVPSISSSLNDIVCIDGTTRYSGMYLGGSSISAVNNGTSCLLVDFGCTPTLAGSNGSNAIGSFYRIEGGVNLTGNLNGISSTLQLNTSGGTATSLSSGIFAFNTISASAGAVTTGRSLRTTATLAGSQTVATFVGLDQSFSNSGASSTVTTGHYIRMVAPTTTGTVTNWDALLIEANAMTVATRKTNLRILGDVESRIVGNVMIGEDSSPGHQLEVKDGNIAITNTGTAGELRLYEPSGSGSNYTAFKTQAQAGNVTYTLPAADAAASGYSLTSNGSGTLSWTNVSGGGGSHNLLSATHSDTVVQTVSRGSLIYGNSTPAWDELTIGASGTVLKSNGTDASWGTVAVPVTYMKTSGTTSSNNTFADDSVMAGMTLATNKYTFIGFFWVSAGATAPDFKFQLVVNTSTVNDLKCFWHATIATGATQEGFITSSGSSSGIINVGSSGQTYVRVTGSLDVTNAGTLDVEWSQNTTDGANPVTMNRGSFFQLTVV